ncbi:hypothetical protein ACJX0J_015764, partial [Zea mays]
VEGEAVSLQQGMQLLPLARLGLGLGRGFGLGAAAAADCVWSRLRGAGRQARGFGT